MHRFVNAMALAALATISSTLRAQFAAGAANVSSEPPAATAHAAALPEATNPKSVKNAAGDTVVVGANGVYLVKFAAPAYGYAGSISDISDVATATGRDKVGDYSEITFKYKAAVGHTAGIRLYKDAPVVIFSNTTDAPGPNDMAFPHWTSFPTTPSHLSFGNIFCTYNFRSLFDDSFWMYFNNNHDAFILSAANDFTISRMAMKGGAMSCGIQNDIKQLPAGFNYRVILAAQNGINKLYSTWGDTLVTLGGKKPPANDASTDLNKIGYWTDNGAAYAYKENQPLGFRGTLLAMRDEFTKKGIDLGFVQLDSWFYPKGQGQTWNNVDGGIYEYTAHPQLFPDGLEAFHKDLGLPMVAHARWLDPTSPYHQQYKTSAASGSPGVVIDKKYFDDRMAYLAKSGVIVYEQDWLGFRGQPEMNLTDNDAYLNNMASATAANGMTMQYCMMHGRHYMQATLYSNLTSLRTSQDRFNTNRWTEFLYGSRVAQAVGTWPWSDVYMSGETRNLLISTLSAGPVGVGDKLGDINAPNLLKAVRPDGVIVKPDVPLTPVDDSYVNDAQQTGLPFVATTYSDNGKSRAVYVFAYGQDPTKLNATVKLSDQGIAGDAYVYDYFAGSGTVVKSGGDCSFTAKFVGTTQPGRGRGRGAAAPATNPSGLVASTQPGSAQPGRGRGGNNAAATLDDATNGGTYLIAVPIGPSGMALVGDTGKFVTRGKKRISSLADDGTLRVALAFAEKEAAVTLTGFAPSRPAAQATTGTAGTVAYDATTHLFALSVSPDKAGAASLTLTLPKAP